MFTIISQDIRSIDAGIPTEGINRRTLEITSDMGKYMLAMPPLDFKVLVYAAVTGKAFGYNDLQVDDLARNFKETRQSVLDSFMRLNRLRIETRRVMAVVWTNGDHTQMFQIVSPTDADIDAIRAKRLKEIT